jgi:hypothetical protein
MGNTRKKHGAKKNKKKHNNVNYARINLNVYLY